MAEMHAKDAEPIARARKERRLSVKLWIIMVLVAAIALPMAWVANRVRTQRRALAMIQRAAGTAWYDYQQIPTGQWDPNIKNPLPGLLLRVIPAECFQDITLINLKNANIGDEDLAALAGLGRVEYLDLEGTRITDAGLAHLRGYGRLKHLWLDRTRIGDAGLAHLSGLHQIRDLTLRGTAVSDAGLDHLRRLPQLRALVLSGTRVSARGVEALKRSRPTIEVESP